MKTTLDIINITYARLASSSLNSTVSGKGYKFKRPVNSELEDWVVNALPITNEQLQAAIVNVNVFAKDIKVTVDGKVNWVPNTTRLKTLADLAVAELTDRISGDYTWDVQQQTVIEDPGSQSHYINIRLQFYVSNI